MRRANDALGWFVVAVIALSPVILGGNTPMVWAASGMLIGVVGVAYGVMAWRSGEALRFPLTRIRAVALLFGALCLYLIAQMLPFGPFAFAGGVEAMSLSLAPGGGWMMLIQTISYGVFFVLVAQMAVNPQRAGVVVLAIFWMLVAHAALGLVQLTQWGDTLLGAQKSYYLGVATGTFISRNAYAAFLAMGVALGAGIVVGALVQRGRLGLAVSTLAGLIVLMLAIIASQSRMGLVCAVLGVVVVAALGARRLLWRGVAWPVVGGSAMVGLFAILLAVPGGGVVERMLALDDTGGGRTAIYPQVLEMTLTRPWTGFGGGAFEVAFPMFAHSPLPIDRVIDKAHSTVLSLFAELGLVFGMVPIIIVAALLVGTMRRSFGGVETVGVRLGAIGAVVVGAVHTAVDFSLEIQANAYLFVALLAIGYAVGPRTMRR